MLHTLFTTSLGSPIPFTLPTPVVSPNALLNDQVFCQVRQWKCFVHVRTNDLESVHVTLLGCIRR